MSADFIDDLLGSLKRVVKPEAALLRDVIILSGLPEGSENLRYLGFNSQTLRQSDCTFEFSAVAVINNRRIPNWRLTGYRRKISRIVFDTRWTSNALDLFVNNLRCEPSMMDLLAESEAYYTLIGILQEIRITPSGRKRRLSVRPVMGIPGLNAEGLKLVTDFENRNEIKASPLRDLFLARATAYQITGR